MHTDCGKYLAMNKPHKLLLYVLVSLSFLSFLVGSKQAKADNIEYLQNFALIYPLSDDWQVYDDKYGAFVPYIAERHQKSKSASFWLDMEQFRDFYLVFYNHSDTYFFINQELCRSFKEDAWTVMKVDSLARLYPNKNQLFCSFYDPQARLPLKYLQISLPLERKINLNQQEKEEDEVSDSSLDLQPRLQSGAKDFVVMLAIALLALFAVLWNYHRKTLRAFYSFRSSLSSLSRTDQSIISKTFEVGNSLFLLTFSALIAYLVLMLQLYSGAGRIYSLLDWEASFGGIMLVYAQYVVATLLLLWLKYWLLRLFATLLSQEKVVKTHFFEYVRLSALFYTAFSFIPFLIIISLPAYLEDFNLYYSYVLLSFHILQTILLSIYIIKLSQFKSLYLFYYLCITELTPLLIGVKLTIFS